MSMRMIPMTRLTKVSMTVPLNKERNRKMVFLNLLREI